MSQEDAGHKGGAASWQLLLELPAESGAGGDEQAVERVARVVEGFLQPGQQGRVGRSVGEALHRAAQRDGRHGLEAATSVRVWISGSSTAGARSRPPGTDPGRQRDGGWGFFLLERQEDGSPGTPPGSGRVIELYLYQEVTRQASWQPPGAPPGPPGPDSR